MFAQRGRLVKFYTGFGVSREGMYVELRLSDKPPQRLEPSATASQAAPKRSYVYGHYDAERVNKNETPSVKV